MKITAWKPADEKDKPFAAFADFKSAPESAATHPEASGMSASGLV